MKADTPSPIIEEISQSADVRQSSKKSAKRVEKPVESRGLSASKGIRDLGKPEDGVVTGEGDADEEAELEKEYEAEQEAQAMEEEARARAMFEAELE